jgi:hypothetical protein
MLCPSLPVLTSLWFLFIAVLILMLIDLSRLKTAAETQWISLYLSQLE